MIAQSSSRHQVPAAPWLHAQAHWCRRCQWWMRTQSAAQAPSGRSTKHSRLQSPGSTLPACRTPKQQACSQCQGLASPAVRPMRAASGRGCAALLAANRARCTLCMPRSSSRRPAGDTACLRACGCSGQPGARCVSLCLHQEASTGAQGTQRPLQHREAF